MRIEVPISNKTQQVYIQGLRDYPDVACRPHTDQSGTTAVFELGLQDVYRCAVTRAVSAQMVSSRLEYLQCTHKYYYIHFKLVGTP